MEELRKIAEQAGVRLEVATKRHARELARSMRGEDKLEIWCSGHIMPEQGVRASINRSCEAWAVRALNGDLLCVFGVCVGQEGWQAPWLLSSTHVDRHRLAFWKASKQILGHLRSKYPLMVQMVHARYIQAIAWVRRLGFSVDAPEQWGAENTLFCKIVLSTSRLIT